MKLSVMIKRLPMVVQLGLSLVVPLLLCIGLCVFLCDRTECGNWIFIPGFILGLGAAFMTAYKLYQAEKKRAEKDEKKPVNFNTHI